MALEAQQLTFGYTAARPVLREVSAVFRPGRVTAVLGPNGSGKTTLLRLLLGLRTANAGRAVLGGREVGSMPRYARAARLAYIPQTSSVAFPFTVRQVVRTGGYSAGASAERLRAAESAIETLGLTGVADETFGLLSAGQQQRVTVARALAQLDGPGHGDEARAILADEPVSAMDPRHAERTLSVLRDRARAGLIVVLVLHDLSAVLRYADDVVMLSGEGTVAAAGGAEPTLTAERLERLFGVAFEPLLGRDGRAGALVPARATTLSSEGVSR